MYVCVYVYTHAIWDIDIDADIIYPKSYISKNGTYPKWYHAQFSKPWTTGKTKAWVLRWPHICETLVESLHFSFHIIQLRAIIQASLLGNKRTCAREPRHSSWGHHRRVSSYSVCQLTTGAHETPGEISWD